MNINENKIKLKFGLGRVENIVGRRESADHQHFLFFPHNIFKRPGALFQGR